MLTGLAQKNQLQTLLQNTLRSMAAWPWVGAAAVCLLLSSCSRTEDIVVDARQWLTWHPALQDSLQRDAVFEFEVMPGSQGRYEISGTTELPDGSRLAIAAVRYLKIDPDITIEPSSPFSEVGEINPSEIDPALPPLSLENTTETETPTSTTSSLQKPRSKRLALDPTYAILDYEQTDVQGGEWSAQLDLWQVAKDGRYQESWQLDQEELNLRWKPEADVIFLATLIVDGAADRLQPVQDELAERQLSLSSTLIQTSLEGEQYFQAAQLEPIALPTGQTTPPGLRVQDINGGWGERYLLVEQDPLPGTLKFPVNRNSNAPGDPVEFIQ